MQLFRKYTEICEERKMNEQNTTGKTFLIPAWVPLAAAAVGIIAILFFPWFSALGFGVGFFHILEHLGSIAELGGSISMFYAALIFYICGSIVSIVKILKKDNKIASSSIVSGVAAAVAFICLLVATSSGVISVFSYVLSVGSGIIIMFIAGLVQAVTGYMISKN